MKLDRARLKDRRQQARARARRNAKREAHHWQFSQTVLAQAVDRNGNIDEVDLEILTASGR